MKNTITVVVNTMTVHRLYGKRFVRSKKYHVHDEIGAKVGDVVNFTDAKPYSKIVKWKTVVVAKNNTRVKKAESLASSKKGTVKEEAVNKKKGKKS